MDSREILISVYPKYMDLMFDGIKNYEFRPFEFDFGDDLVAFWIHETKPVKAITGVMYVSNPISEESDGDPYGLGSEEFKSIVSSGRVAYPIKKIYKLQEPVLLKELQEEFGIKNAPQNYIKLSNYPSLQARLHSSKLFAEMDLPL